MLGNIVSGNSLQSVDIPLPSPEGDLILIVTGQDLLHKGIQFVFTHGITEIDHGGVENREFIDNYPIHTP